MDQEKSKRECKNENDKVLVSSMSSTIAASSRNNAVEGLLALATVPIGSSVGGDDVVEDGDGALVMMLNLLVLGIIKSLVRLLVSQTT